MPCHICCLTSQESVAHRQFFKNNVDCLHLQALAVVCCLSICEWRWKICVLVFGCQSSLLFVFLLQIQAEKPRLNFQCPFSWHIKSSHARTLWPMNYSESNQYGTDQSRWTAFIQFFTGKRSVKWQEPTARWILGSHTQLLKTRKVFQCPI